MAEKMATKATKEVVAVQIAEPYEGPVVNDSSEGLARMYSDLDPLARGVKSAACTLLMFSFLFCGTLEGLFGFVAACGVLCCAAPGPLGVAHASRCAKVCAIVSATLAFFHMMAISTFAAVVLPTMPSTVARMCTAKEREMDSMAYSALPAGKRPAHAFDISDVLVTGKIFAEAVPPLEAELSAKPPTPTEPKPSAKPLAPAEPLVEQLISADGTYTDAAAQFVAGSSLRVARHLEQVVAVVTRVSTFEPAPLSAHCTKVARFFADVAPMAMLMASLVEFCLFLSAMILARRASHIVRAARAYGANGI